jgi:integrase
VLDVSHAFSEGEWALVRTIAEGLQWTYGWPAPAAQRLHCLLDFGDATGLRASELVGATIGRVQTDARGDHWLRVTGKGGKLNLTLSVTCGNSHHTNALPTGKNALDRWSMRSINPSMDAQQRGAQV